MTQFLRGFTFMLLLITVSLLLSNKAYAVNRIGIRQTTNGGEFYDTVTKKAIIFRGHNYILLDPQPIAPGAYAHIIFDVGKYDAENSENFLTNVSNDGYNAIRVFISPYANDNGASSISPQFLNNFADFLKRANDHQVYVLPSISGFPKSYMPQSGSYSNQIEWPNLLYMSQPVIDAQSKYIKDLINGLLSRHAPTQVIIGYELGNEIQYDFTKKPFTLSGNVITATGVFNMSDTRQRQLAMSSNLVYWSNQLTTAVKSVESKALTAGNVFPPTALSSSARGRNAYWMFANPSGGGSTVDFMDIHLYPAVGPINQQMADYEIPSNKKPIVMGEFGADKKSYPQLTTAVTLLRDWQISSCQYNIKGWFTWAIGNGANITGFWAMRESNGALNYILAPKVRQNPCGYTITTTTPSPTTTPRISATNTPSITTTVTITVTASPTVLTKPSQTPNQTTISPSSTNIPDETSLPTVDSVDPDSLTFAIFGLITGVILCIVAILRLLKH